MPRRLRAVVRSVILAINTPLARRRLDRTLRSTARPLKIEIGGLHRRPGWVVTNVNAVARHYLDATSRWPLEDASVTHVFADNVIEHIPLAAGRALLAEAYRCLRPGGAIRLVTPDIGAHVELYRAGPSALSEPEAGYYRAMGLTVEHPVDFVRVPIASFGHHAGYVYDFAALEAELIAAGFRAVTRQELGDSDRPDFRGLDVREDERRVQVAVEATR